MKKNLKLDSKIIKGNIIITLFMSDGTATVNHNKYQDDWNELHAVIDKIESIIFNEPVPDTYYCVNILGGTSACIITNNGEEFCDCYENTKKESVWKACVEFATWYCKKMNWLGE